MILTSTFICGLNNIVVKEDLGEGFSLDPNEKTVPTVPTILLTNNKAVISRYLPKQLSYFIGLVEYDHLLGGYPLVAISKSEIDVKATTSKQHLDLHLYLLKMYFFCLWAVKDNAADFDIGFLYLTTDKGYFETSINNFTSSSFLADGSRKVTEFELSELEKAAYYLKESTYAEFDNRPKVINASSYDRVGIANHFIAHARSCSDLGLRTTSYVTFLETLFTNDSSELAHKLAERVAKFLERDKENRKQLYRLIKKLYDMRSKVVHGASFKLSKSTELEELTIKCDDICRRIMVKIFESYEDENIFGKPQEEIEDYFLNLILE